MENRIVVFKYRVASEKIREIRLHISPSDFYAFCQFVSKKQIYYY